MWKLTKLCLVVFIICYHISAFEEVEASGSAKKSTTTVKKTETWETTEGEGDDDEEGAGAGGGSKTTTISRKKSTTTTEDGDEEGGSKTQTISRKKSTTTTEDGDEEGGSNTKTISRKKSTTTTEDGDEDEDEQKTKTTVKKKTTSTKSKSGSESASTEEEDPPEGEGEEPTKKEVVPGVAPPALPETPATSLLGGVLKPKKPGSGSEEEEPTDGAGGGKTKSPGAGMGGKKGGGGKTPGAGAGSFGGKGSPGGKMGKADPGAAGASAGTAGRASSVAGGGSNGLPFPTEPSKFWGFAINLVAQHYGHFFPAIMANPTFQWAANDSQIFTGPFIGGMILSLSGQEKKEDKKEKAGKKEKGSSNSKTVEVVLNVKDYVFLNLDGSIIMDSVGGDKPPPSTLFTLNPEKVIKKFAIDFGVPSNWPMITKKYKENPKKFVKPYLELFYPASISLYFHGKIDNENGFFEKKLKSRKLINLSAFNTKTFVPERLAFSTNSTIEMMNEEGETIVKIPQFDLITTHSCCEHAATGKIAIPAIKALFGVTNGARKGKLELPAMKGYVHVSVKESDRTEEVGQQGSTNATSTAADSETDVDKEEPKP